MQYFLLKAQTSFCFLNVDAVGFGFVFSVLGLDLGAVPPWAVCSLLLVWILSLGHSQCPWASATLSAQMIDWQPRAWLLLFFKLTSN